MEFSFQLTTVYFTKWYNVNVQKYGVYLNVLTAIITIEMVKWKATW